MSFTKIITSQNRFLEQYLRGTNRGLSSAQARATFGIQNLRARMSELRQRGLRVRKSVNSAGHTVYMISSRDQFGSRAKALV